MSYKAKIFTREEFREVVAAAIYDYEQAPAKCLYTTKDAADQLYGEYGTETEVEVKPRVYDGLVQSAVELSCFGTGQSTIEEGRAAYQAWLKEHDRQIAEKAWEEGYIQAVKNMNPMPGEEPPTYTPNPYAKKELK